MNAKIEILFQCMYSLKFDLKKKKNEEEAENLKDSRI